MRHQQVVSLIHLRLGPYRAHIVHFFFLEVLMLFLPEQLMSPNLQGALKCHCYHKLPLSLNFLNLLHLYDSQLARIYSKNVTVEKNAKCWLTCICFGSEKSRPDMSIN